MNTLGFVLDRHGILNDSMSTGEQKCLRALKSKILEF